MYALTGGDDSKIKLNGICEAQSKPIKLVVYKNCLDGKHY